MSKVRHCRLGLLVITLMCVTLLSGCGIFNSNKSTLGNNHSTSNITNLDTYISELTVLIADGDITTKTLLTEDFIYNESDIISDVAVNNYYTSNNAVFMQVASGETQYMFRFQLDSNNMIASYIKYSLEG